MSKQLKELMDMLENRRLHPAMRMEEDMAIAKEEGRELHPLVLSPTRNNPSLIYVHPTRFLDELKKLGERLNYQTLEFEKIPKDKPASTPAPEPAPEPKPAAETDSYTKEELEAMDWETIRKVAKADPEIPGNKSKAWLTENLVGRPKFPLKE